MLKKFCTVAGAALILVGIAGFFAPELLGMHLTPIHDVIHVLTGAASLYFGVKGSASATQVFARAFGGVYLLLGILGFVAPALVGTVLGHAAPLTSRDLLPDNLVHVAAGGAFLVMALVARSGASSASVPHATARRAS